LRTGVEEARGAVLGLERCKVPLLDGGLEAVVKYVNRKVSVSSRSFKTYTLGGVDTYPMTRGPYSTPARVTVAAEMEPSVVDFAWSVSVQTALN